MEIQDVKAEVLKESCMAGMDVLKAERERCSTLILVKHPPIKRFDGKTGTLTIIYRWHRDEYVDVHSVQGEDITIWKPKELGDYKNKSLFDLVDLF